MTRPPRGTHRRRLITATVVILAFALAGLAVLVIRHAVDPPSVIPVLRSPHPYAAQLRDGVVVAESPGHPTIDIFEDPMCPACGHLEAQILRPLSTAAAAHTVTVRYHIINFLDALSNPPGYPLNAANALLCSAQYGLFADYHTSLFAAQPAEGSAGYSIDTLTNLGTTLGAPPDFSTCLRTGRHYQQVRDQLAALMNDPHARTTLPNGQSAVGTPTVLINGTPTTNPSTAILQLTSH
jgi:protein-disulfide isomerase